jgi:hypothetical protein
MANEKSHRLKKTLLFIAFRQALKQKRPSTEAGFAIGSPISPWRLSATSDHMREYQVITAMISFDLFHPIDIVA